jgi:ribosomal protein S18 acetylase RimI-like enzyme
MNRIQKSLLKKTNYLTLQLLLCGLLTLANFSAHANDLRYSLGQPYAHKYFSFKDGQINAIGRDLYEDNTPVGKIVYQDSAPGLRYIHELGIEAHRRNNGIGSECMRQFIQQSNRDGIKYIELESLEE